MERNEQAFPQARTEDLVTQEMPDEVLVYDLKNHKAHCLNRTAAQVWHLCDGKTSPTEIAQKLAREVDKPIDEELVWMAVEQLGKSSLLLKQVIPFSGSVRYSRRAMMQRLGTVTALTLPLVTSILVPMAVEAATCPGGVCFEDPGPQPNDCGACANVTGDCFSGNNCNGSSSTTTCQACGGNSWRSP